MLSSRARPCNFALRSGALVQLCRKHRTSNTLSCSACAAPQRCIADAAANRAPRDCHSDAGTATPPPSSVAPSRSAVLPAHARRDTALRSSAAIVGLLPRAEQGRTIHNSGLGGGRFQLRHSRTPGYVRNAELIAPMALANGGVAAVSYG